MRLQLTAAGPAACLMGAIANSGPDLLRRHIIGEVPFQSMFLTTDFSTTTLPLTPPEWTEWGDPREDVAAFPHHQNG
jgi:oligopeptidase B